MPRPVPQRLAAWCRRGLGVGLSLSSVLALAQGPVQRPHELVISLTQPARRAAHDAAALTHGVWRSHACTEGGVGTPGCGTPLAVDWRPARATVWLGLEHGALGMQLKPGYRLSLKLRGGGPSLYLRSQF